MHGPGNDQADSDISGSFTENQTDQGFDRLPLLCQHERFSSALRAFDSVVFVVMLLARIRPQKSGVKQEAVGRQAVLSNRAT